MYHSTLRWRVMRKENVGGLGKAAHEGHGDVTLYSYKIVKAVDMVAIAT